MKKYFVIMASTIIFAMIIQMVYQKEEIESEWIESCYGIQCDGFTPEPTPPRTDWGWSSDYCKFYNFRVIYPDNSTYDLHGSFNCTL